MSKLTGKITNGITCTNVGKRTLFGANVYTCPHDFIMLKQCFFILLQTDTLEMKQQINKGRFIIADINRSFTNCLNWIALKYFLSIIDGSKYMAFMSG